MSGDTAIRGMLALCAVILMAAALYLARSISRGLPSLFRHGDCLALSKGTAGKNAEAHRTCIHASPDARCP